MLDNDEFYDLTMEFLTAGGRTDRRRPEAVKKVLENLKEVAPAHAKVLMEYLNKLEAPEDE